MIYLALLHLLHLKKRELQVCNGLIFANLIHHDTAFVPAHLGSGAIPFFHFQLDKLRPMRSSPFLQAGSQNPAGASPRSMCFSVLFDAPVATWAILSAPGEQVCENDKSFWQSSPISSFRVLFQKGGCVKITSVNPRVGAEIAAFFRAEQGWF